MSVYYILQVILDWGWVLYRTQYQEKFMIITILIIYMKMKTESKEKKITSIQNTLSIQRWEELNFLKIFAPNYFKIYDEINELEPENEPDNQSRTMVEQ